MQSKQNLAQLQTELDRSSVKRVATETTLEQSLKQVSGLEERIRADPDLATKDA